MRAPGMIGPLPMLLVRLSWIAAMLLVASGHARADSIEAAVKATYLDKFPPFIDWPASTLASLRTFTICVVGTDTLGPVLDEAVSGQQIKGRPIVVLRLLAVSDAGSCQLVYATGSASQSVSVILAALRGRPIVTVTDGEREPRSKGMFNFVIVDNRVRFEVDDKAAVEAGLTISSKLLSLAISVQPGP